MPDPDARWAVPDEYEVENTEGRVLVPHRWGAVVGRPNTNLAALRAFEDRLNATDTRSVDRPVFSLCAGWPWKVAAEVRELWAREPPSSVEDRLLAAEILSINNVIDDDDETSGAVRAADIFRELWQDRDRIDDPVLVLRIGSGLARETPRRHRDDTDCLEIFDRTAAALDRAPPLAAGAFQLHLAATLRSYEPKRETRPEAHAFEAACTAFESVGDALGLAECALFEALRREERRPDDLRQPIEHAIYRYDACGRRAWAAAVVCYRLAPLSIDELGRNHARVRECFDHAMNLIAIHRGPDDPTDMVLRLATRMGFTATHSPDFGWQFSLAQRAAS